MRTAFIFLGLVLLFGCLGIGEAPKISDFEGELVLENVSDSDVEIEDIDMSEADAVFEGMVLEKENISVVYFYNQNCSACKVLEQWLIQEKKKYNASVIWFEYDIGTSDGWEKYLLFADAYGVPKNETYVPMAYAGGKYFWGIDGIRNELGNEIEGCRTDGCYGPFELLNG